MVQFLSIFFFLGFLQFLLGFSKVPVFLCHPVYEVRKNNAWAECRLLKVAAYGLLTGFRKVRSEYQHNTSLHLESRC